MSKTRRNNPHVDDNGQGMRSQRRHTRTERVKEFEQEYIRKNKIPIITL